MSRVVRTESAARERTRLLQSMAHVIRSAAGVGRAQTEQLDMLAFLSLALHSAQQSVQATVEAWEKRGYWLKADRFEREWVWTGGQQRALDRLLQSGDLTDAGTILAAVASQLNAIAVPARMTKTEPWHGALTEWRAQQART